MRKSEATKILKALGYNDANWSKIYEFVTTLAKYGIEINSLKMAYGIGEDFARGSKEMLSKRLNDQYEAGFRKGFVTAEKSIYEARDLMDPNYHLEIIRKERNNVQFEQ